MFMADPNEWSELYAGSSGQIQNLQYDQESSEDEPCKDVVEDRTKNKRYYASIQHIKPVVTPSILQSDPFRQVADKYFDCLLRYPRDWPAEVKIMRKVAILRNQIRQRAWLLCYDLRNAKEEVAEFRKVYAQTRKVDEGTKPSTGATEVLEATDDAPIPPAIDNDP